MSLLPELRDTVGSLTEEFDQIPVARKRHLGRLAEFIGRRIDDSGGANITFICTHNSRRSHMAHLWTSAAARFYGIDRLKGFSGGTEVTAFNERAVAALRRAGFQIQDATGENPHYEVVYATDAPPLTSYSKLFDDPVNPQSDFAAVMTCSEADADCPYIPGATRIPITYEDPKVADGSAHESERYDERVRQIGREMLYAISLVKHLP